MAYEALLSLLSFCHDFIVPGIDDWYFFPFGSFGVRLFFVLSGFLITGILLRGRDLVESGQTVSYTLSSFYFRRTLRIFCVFYAWLFFNELFVTHSPRLWWDLAYLSNFYDILYLNGNGNQYWSLAVEEQFYLLWPFFILFCPRRYMLVSMLSLITVVMLTRGVAAFSDVPYLVVKKLPIFCMDALGLGALIAFAFHSHRDFVVRNTRKLSIIAGAVGAGVIVCALISLKLSGVKGASYTSSLHSGLALLSAGLLLPAIRGYKGVFGSILKWKPLCFLGTISYGCYLYHLFVRSIVDSMDLLGGVDLLMPKALCDFWLKVFVTICVATVSWYVFEKPVNGLKDWMPTNRARLEECRSRLKILVKRLLLKR